MTYKIHILYKNGDIYDSVDEYTNSYELIKNLNLEDVTSVYITEVDTKRQLLTYLELSALQLSMNANIRVVYDTGYCYDSTYRWCKAIYSDEFCIKQGIKFEVIK